MGRSTWTPNQEEVTLASGRTFLLRRSLPMTWFTQYVRKEGDEAAIAALSLFQTGEAEDADPEALFPLFEKLVIAMCLEPRVVATEEDVPPGADEPDEDGGRPLVVPFSELTDVEISEIVRRGFQGVADAASFRDGDGDGDHGRGDGEDLGDDPKPRPRARTRKP